jgi:hypothetical protein
LRYVVVLYLKGNHIRAIGAMGFPAIELGTVQSLDLIKIME